MNAASLMLQLPDGRRQAVTVTPTMRFSGTGRPVWRVQNVATGAALHTDDLSRSWFSKALPWIAGAVGALLIPGVGAAVGGLLGGVGTAAASVVGTVGTALGGVGTTVGSLASTVGTLGTAASAVKTITGGSSGPSGSAAPSASQSAQYTQQIQANTDAINNGTITDAQLASLVNAGPNLIPQSAETYQLSQQWQTLYSKAVSEQLMRSTGMTLARNSAPGTPGASYRPFYGAPVTAAPAAPAQAPAAPAQAPDLSPYVAQYNAEAGYVAQYTPVYQNGANYVAAYQAQGNPAAAAQWQAYLPQLGAWLQSATQWLGTMKQWIAAQGGSV